MPNLYKTAYNKKCIGSLSSIELFLLKYIKGSTHNPFKIKSK